MFDCGDDDRHVEFFDEIRATIDATLQQVCGGTTCRLDRASYCVSQLETFVSGPTLEYIQWLIVSSAIMLPYMYMYMYV